MLSLLLPLVFLSFVSLGLPDSLLGAVWPAVAGQMGKELSALGLVAMLITLGTVVSSLFSSRMIRSLGTGRVMVMSVFLTSAVLLLYSFARNYAVLCLLALPLGLGGGSVDAALNGFVARNYKASHMNWLHCMWGVGATLSPVLAGISLRGAGGWPGAYRLVAIIQGVLFFALFVSLPQWLKAEKDDPLAASGSVSPMGNRKALRTPGLITAMAAFACFVGFESTAGVWASSFLKGGKGFDASTAALFSSLYYLGTTAGRAVSGFIAIRADSRKMIRLGCLLAFFGAMLLALPLNKEMSLAGYILLGLGNAPIYPSMIHLTPRRFRVNASQAAMGLQMAAAYTGSALLPPLIGALVHHYSLQVVPWMTMALVAAGYLLSRRIDRVTVHAD